MYRAQRIAAVVPAHDEEHFIGAVLDTMPECVDVVVVVDDGSSDETAKRVVEIGDPRVVLVRHEVNQGTGGAIVTGHRTALELGTDIHVVVAGDGQADPAYLTDLLDAVIVRGFDFAKANRFSRHASLRGMPYHRVVGSVVLSVLTKAASGYWHLFDSQNGYTAIRRDVVERLPLDRLARNYAFENDLLVALGALRVRAVDVPVPAKYGDEVSGIRVRTVVPQIGTVLARGFTRRMLAKFGRGPEPRIAAGGVVR